MGIAVTGAVAVAIVGILVGIVASIAVGTIASWNSSSSSNALITLREVRDSLSSAISVAKEQNNNIIVHVENTWLAPDNIWIGVDGWDQEYNVPAFFGAYADHITTQVNNHAGNILASSGLFKSPQI